MSSRLMLIEDDESLGQTLYERLLKEGYQVTWAKTLAEGKKCLETQSMDLLILDVGLPDGNAFDWVKEYQNVYEVPLIFVTAQSGAEERLRGYELGAEEYIPKPFHLKELLLRVRHVLDNHSPAALVKVEDMTIDFSSGMVQGSSGTKSFLPTRDLKVLEHLVQKSPQVVSRDEILDSLWGEDHFPSNRTVDNIIVRLRQVLGPLAGVWLRSVRGVGYQWVQPKKGEQDVQ